MVLGVPSLKHFMQHQWNLQAKNKAPARLHRSTSAFGCAKDTVCMYVCKIVLSELSECPENEYNEFPQRMRDWLFRIMRELVSTLLSFR